jgi:hypothetical protein
MGEGAHRLLKLLCWRLFDTARYSNRDPDVRLRGAYGTVYKAFLPSEPFEVAVKVMEMPKNIYDPSLLGDIYTEVTCTFLPFLLLRTAQYCVRTEYGHICVFTLYSTCLVLPQPWTRPVAFANLSGQAQSD